MKSFRTKIIVTFAVIEAILLLVIIFHGLNLMRSSNEAELAKRADITAQLFATSAIDGVLSEDLASLQSLTQQLFIQPGIVYARVRGHSEILAASGDQAALQRPFQEDISFVSANIDNIYDISTAITVSGETYGQVELGISLSSLHKTMVDAKKNALAIAVIEIVIVIVVSLLLGTYLTRGLTSLNQGVKQISKGNLGYTIKVAGSDELANTANAFNQMSQKLYDSDNKRKKAEKEITQLNKELEQRVKIRTEELAGLNKKLEHQTLHDSLTKLANRTLFQDRVQYTIATAKRNNKKLAIVMLDLNGFKEINDSMGHQTGDLVLQKVALIMRNAIRDSDTLARLGGDEFCILLPDIDSESEAIEAACRFAKTIEAPFSIADQSLHVGASLGLAFYPDHGEDIETLLQASDVAMYEAKQSGHTYVVYHKEMGIRNKDHLSLRNDLKLAIEKDELVLHYQPKIDFNTDEVCGVEALLRWQHPTRGLLFPDSFIPLAEKSGLIRPLTEWVIKHTLRQWSDWRHASIDLMVSINISVNNLHDPELIRLIESSIKQYPDIENWLELEITESALMSDPVVAIETVRRLSALGIKVAIDDFGTGYSSMSYLKKLLVAKIKIDKSFVMGMESNNNDAVIVRSTIELGHNLGLEVIAEGVESRGSMSSLKKMGCDAIQGYYLSRPITADEFTHWFESYNNGPEA